jgi:succinyl-CoA synthetase beta subunit/citryl-CoA synthetase large subunit
LRLYEYEAKKILSSAGIPIPKGDLASSVDQVEEIIDRVRAPLVLKPQIPVGGRMKSGGIQFVDNSVEAREKAKYLLNSSLKGYKIDKLLMEEKLEFEEEYYLAVTYDRSKKSPLVILSPQGGINVEESSDKAITVHFSLLRPFSKYKAHELASTLKLKGQLFLSLSDIICKLTKLFYEYDATLTEINPLVRSRREAFIALDAHIDIDDDALYRHPELKDKFGIEKRKERTSKVTLFEKEAARIDGQDYRGVAGRLVEFEGNLGLLIGGGGASLTVFDAIVRYGGSPANYCEIGGNPSVKKLKDLTKLILTKPGVKKIAVIMNITSNSRVDLIARGVIKGVMESGYIPHEKIALFRVPGAWEKEGAKILKKYGVKYYGRDISIDQAAKKVVKMLEAN